MRRADCQAICNCVSTTLILGNTEKLREEGRFDIESEAICEELYSRNETCSVIGGSHVLRGFADEDGGGRLMASSQILETSYQEDEEIVGENNATLADRGGSRARVSED